ncbi:MULTISPECIES: nitroreductase family protein [unclassified Saccharibacter]|uniref:nitroreductase family protein n=1 Tax=unclassified Saccharibacter TaxID=2648722 RepID=UPI0013281923|nr:MULTISPECIES: nitroreductase family protein [unclassified Saccharibacter]MXV35699.1 nitroreductase family protein [Saccharibacter sp. EH611]MXV58313.1 nitroreductase family protein [Saccharibacter sp. EH70]MXV65789.1 nitroreductase family protein [Saccharibacter sp. EH60]
MTDILTAIKNRRSFKNFDPNYVLSQEDLTAILDTTRYAPTAFNIQNYRFLVVRDAEQREKITQAAWNQPQINSCSALIVMCADLKAWEKEPRRYWANAPEEVQALYAEKMIPNYYEGKEQVQRDEGFRSASMAAYALMMTAQAYGLDSCAMDGFDFEQVKQIINLPEDHELIMFVAIGKAVSEPKPRSGMLPLEEIVRFDRF